MKYHKEQTEDIRNVNETELQMFQNNISLEKNNWKNTNGKEECVNVDMMERWAMTDGIFLSYDRKHKNFMAPKGGQCSAKWAKH